MEIELNWIRPLDDGTLYIIGLPLDAIYNNMTIFGPFVISAINAVLIRDDITLNEPSDLLRVFEKGSEEPDVIFKHNDIRYSMNNFFNSIPYETKDLILSPDMPTKTSQIGFSPRFMSVRDRLMTHIIDSYTYKDVPSSVRFSLAKFILLMYIDESIKLEALEVTSIAEDIHGGDDPKSYARMGNLAQFDFVKDQEGKYKYKFMINRYIIRAILNMYRVVDIDRTYVMYVESLPYRIIESISDYTHTNFRDVNTFLRKGRLSGSPDDEWLDKIKKDIENIDEAFLDAPPLEKPLTLYRGQKKKISDAKAYSSTTTDLSTILVDDFLNLRDRCCLYVITAVPGSKILPIMNISHVQFEEEVLLDRNAKYIITNIEYKEYTVKDASSGRVKYETRRIRTIYVTYMPGDSQMIPPPSYTKPEDEYSSDDDY